MKTIILFIAFMIIGYRSLAQNYLLEPMTNSSFVAGAVGVEEGAMFSSSMVGFSLNGGRLDISLLGSHKNENRYLTFNAASLGINYLFIKQNKLPLSVGASVEYEYKAFPQSHRTKHNSFKVGISIYHRFRINDNVALIPGIYGKKNLIRYTIGENAGNISSYTTGLQNTLLLKNFSITPGVSYTEKRGYLFTIQFGLILFKRESIKSVYEP